MRWALVILLSLIGAVFSSEDESNEIIIAPSSTKSPINLDTSLRKALLKALVELENEEKENLQRNSSNDYVNIITHLDSRDKSVEKASASSISFFSQTEPVNMTVTVKKTTSKPKQSVVVQRSKGTQKTIYEIEDLNVSDTPERIIASASNSFASAKSEKSKTITGGAKLNSLTEVGKSKKSKYQQTTTVKPTSSTEESEANVESLQFFSAPLVAAFTVHQDEKGLPRSVVPIYNQGNVAANTTESQLKTNIKNQEELQKEVLKQQRELEARQEAELKTKQLNLQQEIQRLTKLREEQEKLILQQKLAYEQKLLEQQRKLLEEQTRLFNVQSFVPVQPITTTAKPVIQTNINDNFRSSARDVGTIFSIQPSIGFVQPVVSNLPLNAQILPIKNPVDFRTPYPRTFSQFRSPNDISSQSFLTRSQSTLVPSTTLNTIQNSIVPSVNIAQNSVVPLVDFSQNSGAFQSLPSTQINSIFHQPSPISQNVFQTNQNLPFASSQIVPFRNSAASSHGSRILRQESGTGNFGNNNRYNTQQTSNNFFGGHRFSSNSILPQHGLQTTQSLRSNFGFSNPNNLNQYQYNTLQYSVDQPFLNQRFNNLLLHTGLGQGKQQENLNIVSKVLSLNHLGAESPSSTTNNDFTRIRAPAPWRVV